MKADLTILISRPDSKVEFTSVIQHGDSHQTALEEWITFSRAKAHEQKVNE